MFSQDQEKSSQTRRGFQKAREEGDRMETPSWEETEKKNLVYWVYESDKVNGSSECHP